MAEAARKRESSSEREMPVCKYARLETPVSGRDESCAVATVQPSPGVPERACLRGSAMAEKDLKNEVAQEDVLRECIESEVEAPRAMLDCELSNLNVDWTRLLERGVNEVTQLRFVPFRQWEFDQVPTALLSGGILYMRHGAEGEDSRFRKDLGAMVQVSDYHNATPTSCKEIANEAVLKTVACSWSSAWNVEDDLQGVKCILSSDSTPESNDNSPEYDREQSLENLPQAASLFVQIFAMAVERLLPREDLNLPIDRHLSVVRYLRKQWGMLDQDDRRSYAEAAQQLREDHFEPWQDESYHAHLSSQFAKCSFATDEDARLCLNEKLSLSAYMQYSAESVDDDQSSWYTDTLQAHSQLHKDFGTTLTRGELLKTLGVIPEDPTYDTQLAPYQFNTFMARPFV